MGRPELLDLALRLAVAALAGLAVGVEREWSARNSATPPRFAGVRTFLLLGLFGGLASALPAGGAGLVLLAGGVALTVAAYLTRARRGDVDATTEVAALVVLAIGFLAGGGHLALASGLSAATAFVLAEKSFFHSAVAKIKSQELEAGARFAVLALVVLPILPAGPFGPEPGFRPRELWALMLVFSGVSFAGFVAVRVAGPGRGYGIAGLLGGLISSTAVTLTFSRESRSQPSMGNALALGVLAACTALCFRVAILAFALKPELGQEAAPYLAVPALLGGLLSLSLFRKPLGAREVEMPGNPLQLRIAIAMTVGLQLVLYSFSWVKGQFGSPGMLPSAALVGLLDMDALVYSMVKLGADGPGVSLAARGLAVGVLSNTLLKLTLAVALGSGPFRRAAGGGLVLLALASLAGLVLLP